MSALYADRVCAPVKGSRNPRHTHRGGAVKLQPIAYLDMGTRTSSRDSSWHSISPAYRYARAQLRRMESEHSEVGLRGATSDARAKMLDTLREVLATDTVFPTMSIDEDGGVAAEWRVGEVAIEIDCAPDGAMTYTARVAGAEVTSGSSTTPLRRLIRDMTAYVMKHNANWRALFRDSPPSGVR